MTAMFGISARHQIYVRIPAVDPAVRTIDDTMIRISWVSCIMLLISSELRAHGDDEILKTVRTKATKIFLEQASWTLPESFHKSGLAPSDKERLIEQWADASANCLVDALSKYADSTNFPLSELVNDDGSFSLKGDGSSSDFNLNLDTCIERAWQTAGARLP